MSNNDHNIVAGGWLYKKSKHIGVWRKRWTVLTTDRLCTYKQQEIYENPTEIIKLSDIVDIKSNSALLFSVSKHNKDIIQFRSETETLKREWIEDIGYIMDFIEVPICVACKNNSQFSCEFSIVLPYKDYNLQQMMDKITQYLNQKRKKDTMFIPIRVLSSSYFRKEIFVNNDTLNNDSFKMINYPKNVVIEKGIALEIEAVDPYKDDDNKIISTRTPHICRFRTETISQKMKCVVPKQKYIICGFLRNSTKLIDAIPNDILLLICIMIDYTESYSSHDFTLLRSGCCVTFGTSLIVLQKETKRIFLMKILKKQKIFQRHQVHHVKKERRILGELNHPFILKLHYAFQTDYKLFIIMDYCDGGEIFFHLSKAGRFTEERTRFYMAEIVLAIGYIHSKNIIHRGLKPENILLDKDGHIQLDDFMLGNENVTNNTCEHDFCGTPEYIAPEMLRKVGHGFPVDWWSVGCIMYEMLCGIPPFYSRNRDTLFAKILRQKIRYPNYFSDISIDMIKQLLQRNPKDRLGSRGGFKEIQKHMFFKDMDWEALYKREIQSPFVPVRKEWEYIESDPDYGVVVIDEEQQQNGRKYAPFDGFEFDGNVEIFI